jgi:hypothetical protein
MKNLSCCRCRATSRDAVRTRPHLTNKKDEDYASKMGEMGQSDVFRDSMKDLIFGKKR